MKTKKRFIPLFLSRPWLVGLIAFILLSTIIIVSQQSFIATEKTAFDEFNRRQLVMATEAANGIQMHFDFLAGAMKAIGNQVVLAQYEEKIVRQIYSLEMYELKTLGINDIGLLDKNGILKYNASAQQLEGADFSWRKYFQKTKKMTDNHSYIIQFIEFKGADAGQKGVLVAVPMFESQVDEFAGSKKTKFSGVILCTLKLDGLTKKFVAAIKPSCNGYAFLIDSNYNVLSSPDVTLFGKNFLKETEKFPSFQKILEEMNAGNSSTAEYSYRSFNSSEQKFSNKVEENLIAFVPVNVGEEQWSIGVGVPKNDAKKLIHSVYVKQMILVVLILITASIGSTYLITLSFSYKKTLESEVDIKTREFKESHQRLLTVLDSLDAGVYVSDMESYEILFVNEYLRISFGDVIGKICWQVFQPDQTGPCDFCKKDKLLAADGEPGEICVWEYQNKITGKWYDVHDRAIRWVDGRMVKLEIATDITARKIAALELERAHNEMGTFCNILKQIGTQETLDGVGSFLMNELTRILNTPYMQLYVFSSARDSLFVLSANETSVVNDPATIQTVATIIENLDGVTMGLEKTFEPPLLPEYFPTKGRQTIIPFRVQDFNDGVFVVACTPDCLCDRNKLDLVSLILEKASGTIKRAVLHHEELQVLESRIANISEFRGIIGKDPKMQVVYKLIDDIAPTDATILIQGETGTGKEMVARATHKKSLRRNKPFIVINCSAYPATLLESELFGHEKGAFTGAVRQKIGRFEQAHGGTVFLDEIGEISPSAQIKLLRVLQTQKFERLGGEHTVKVNVRILAATNKDLLEEVKKGNFREDLYYRLNVIPIQLPPLRQRRNDIPLLTRHFQRKFSKEHGVSFKEFSSDVMRQLLNYTWPGNVRELENSIEHAVVLSKDKNGRIEVSHLPTSIISYHINLAAPTSTKPRTILENEKKLLKDVLEECNWNKSQAALRLGISRSTLYGKLKKYQIDSTTPH